LPAAQPGGTGVGQLAKGAIHGHRQAAPPGSMLALYTDIALLLARTTAQTAR
jgi:hypothetical protein